MRMRNWAVAGAAMLALAACSDASYESEAAYEDAAYDTEVGADYAASEAAADVAEGSTIPELGNIPVSLPKLAYTYDYRWSLPAEDIGARQRRTDVESHIDAFRCIRSRNRRVEIIRPIRNCRVHFARIE